VVTRTRWIVCWFVCTSAQASSQSRSAQTIPTSTTQRVFKKAARKLNR